MADFTRFGVPAEEWIEFSKTNTTPSPEPGSTPEQARIHFNNTRAQLFRDVFGPVDVVSWDVDLVTSDSRMINARIYRPRNIIEELPLYIHLHGGGFHLGNLETEDTFCRLLSVHMSIAVFNVNYRHTPEWTFPTAVNDASDALNWIIRDAAKYNIDSSKVIIGGISAGASLACAVALRDLHSEQNRIRGVALTIPPTVHETLFPRELIKEGHTSLEQNSEAPILPLSRCRKFVEMYNPEPSHPYFSPLIQADTEFCGFPRTCFFIAALDPLRDEGLLFEEKLRRVGVETRLEVYAGFPHGFMGFPQLKESEKWREDLYRSIRWLIEAKDYP